MSTKTPSPQPIVRTNASEAIREQLLDLVRAGTYPVGSKLPSEHELARSFGVSRPVVREALGALGAAGLVEARTGVGTFVRAKEPSLSGVVLLGRYSVADLHEVRTHLEVPGAALAARRRSPEQLQSIAEIVARHSEGKSAPEWVQDDIAFHIALAEATGNEVHVRLVADLRELQVEQSILTAQATGGLEAPEEEHARILAAIAAGDEEAAAAAMAAHLDAIRGRLASIEGEG
jgi:GntR family transcriptional regulator, transcriptional repressor for pyruvate dehydrogenase complex